MDDARKIRFLYPPVIFVVAVAWAFELDPNESLLKLFNNVNAKDFVDVVGIIVGAGLLLVTLGFVFGTIAHFVLRLLGWVRLIRDYEAMDLPESTQRAIWRHLGGQEASFVDASPFLPYFASAFHHGPLSDSHRSWMDRRWNAFNLGTHSAVALFSAILVVRCSSLRPGCCWYVGACIGMAIFLANAWSAWYDTQQMTKLLAIIPPEKRDDHESSPPE